jgi:hypothetical protein
MCSLSRRERKDCAIIILVVLLDLLVDFLILGRVGVGRRDLGHVDLSQLGGRG